MPNPTLREIVETFTEEELSLTVPIEFQDVSADDYPYVNEYNRLLASAQTNADTDEGYDAFVAANEYRTVNQEHIDKYVLDAKKLNILMTLVINAYMFAKGEKSATNTSYDNSISGASSTNVQDVIDECFQSVSSGKALVASAITDKKVPTDATATFQEMYDNIMKIVLGSGNAIAENVLIGKTFTNDDGVEYTGTMPDNSNGVYSIDESGTCVIPKGYYDGTTVVTSDVIKQGIIDSLKNTNLHLTSTSSWIEIFQGLNKLFPETLNVLAYLGISSLSISGSSTSGSSHGGTWHYKSSGKFDITHFNTLTYVLSLDTSGGQANCILYYEGGTMTLTAGSKSVNVSACIGDAYFRVGQTQVWHDSGEGWSSGGAAHLTAAKLYV